MRVCGVELKGNDAIVCLMALADGLYDIPQLRVQKFQLLMQVMQSKYASFSLLLLNLLKIIKLIKL